MSTSSNVEGGSAVDRILDSEQGSLGHFHHESSRSLSTTGNGSRAANSVLTCDETIVRRGDGAQVRPSSKGISVSDPLMFVQTSMRGSSTKNNQENEKWSWSDKFELCCCCFRKKASV